MGLKGFYQLVGAESEERRKEQLERGCFCWTPVHFFPSLIQSKRYLSSSTTFPISKLHSNPSRKLLRFSFQSCIYLLLDFHRSSLCLISEKQIPCDRCLRLFFALEVTGQSVPRKKEIKEPKATRSPKGIFYQILSRAEHWASYFSRSTF